MKGSAPYSSGRRSRELDCIYSCKPQHFQDCLPSSAFLDANNAHRQRESYNRQPPERSPSRLMASTSPYPPLNCEPTAGVARGEGLHYSPPAKARSNDPGRQLAPMSRSPCSWVVKEPLMSSSCQSDIPKRDGDRVMWRGTAFTPAMSLTTTESFEASAHSSEVQFPEKAHL